MQINENKNLKNIITGNVISCKGFSGFEPEI